MLLDEPIGGDENEMLDSDDGDEIAELGSENEDQGLNGLDEEAVVDDEDGEAELRDVGGLPDSNGNVGAGTSSNSTSKNNPSQSTQYTRTGRQVKQSSALRDYLLDF